MVIKSNILIPKGIRAITIFVFIFVRKDVSEETIRHEKIHVRQVLELLLFGFYVWYVTELFVRAFTNRGYAYKNISLEREAYANASNPEYLKERKLYSWIKYL